jgi:hypothetical protein
MENHPSTSTGDRAKFAIVLVGSNVTAIAAELAVLEGGYPKAIAIARRGATTRLPVLPDSNPLVDSMKYLRDFGARKKIGKFNRRVDEIVGGEPFDCFIHHSMAPFSQVLTAHPLCRRYFYLEEGVTAMVGGQFGRTKKRWLKRTLWKIRSQLFFGGIVDKYRPFFDVNDPKYGGVCALSQAAFADFPNRIQLPFKELAATVPVPAEAMVFVDSQHILGNCTTDEYLTALKDALTAVLPSPTTVAIKFHPAEKDPARRSRFIGEISALPCVSSLVELPLDYVAERMAFDPSTKIFIGTSSLGFYTGERGFQTYTFAPRIAAASPKFAAVMEAFPKQFIEVCTPA